MEIDGKILQGKILDDLKKEIDKLKEKGVTPGIAIITLGPEASWEAYVKQKIKLAEELGINKKLYSFNPESTEKVIELIENLNDDPSIHGLIVQRPFPSYIDTERVIQSVSKEKDIDGFKKDSEYEVPVWLAVKHLIAHIAKLLGEANLQNFLSNQSILVIGKGETAGLPTILGLQKMGLNPMVIDSKTAYPDNLILKADIIISAVGKDNIIKKENLKKGSILIGIGLHRENGKLVGDYDEKTIKDESAFYTPSPRGVGPLNLAFLFKNLITATKKSIDKKRDNP